MTVDAHDRRGLVWPHLVAGALALAYALAISRTRLVASGAQFVAPVLVILAVHVASLLATRERRPGFSLVALRRTVVTSLALVVGAALFVVVAPMPVEAAQDPVNALLGVLVCLAILVVVLAVTAGAIYIGVYALIFTVRGLWWLAMRAINRNAPPGGTGLNDMGILALASLALIGASLEGVDRTLTLAAYDRVETSLPVAAQPAAVWAAIGKASSPELPLPLLLQTLPRAVAVTDGGAEIGSRRIIHFRGREGAGDLVLEVTAKTDREMIWQAVADTTPMRGWVAPRHIVYRVDERPGGAQVSVAIDYERRLAPAWFFRFYMRAVARESVMVLASDKKTRAEALMRR